MSTSCDCDRQTANGGNCDSSCSKEEVYDTVIQNNAGPTIGFPILTFTKAVKVAQATFKQLGDGEVAPHA